MTAGQHQGVNTPDTVLRDHRGASSSANQEPPGHGQLLTGHLDGALMKVGATGEGRAVFKVTMGRHEMGQRHIAVAVAQLGLRHVLADMNIVILGHVADKPQDFAQYLFWFMPGQNGVGYNQSPGVDKGVSRDAFFVLQLQD